jgi:type II secretory pathway component PulM
MMERFRQLAPREQIVLGLGAALAFLIIGWSFIWTPLANTVEELRESVRDNSRLMVDLRRAATLPSTAVPSTATGGDSDWYALVGETAGPMGLASAFTQQRLEPATNSFRITFQNVSFAMLVEWLVLIDRDHGVQVALVQLSPAPAGPGLVRGQLVLSRS